jgi:putative peptide zinc metalloprotease protein
MNEPPTHVLDPPPASAPTALAPRLADGIELIGEYEDSGFKEPPYLARRADGQTLQLTRLLYTVAEAADGVRDYAAMAEVVTPAVRRHVTADNIHFLVEKKLRPLGVIAAADGSSPQLEKPDPLLALKFRTAVIPERVTRALTTVFRPLYLPPVLAAVIVAFLALDAWLFLHHGIAPGLRRTLYQPLLLVVLFAGVVVATAFHEIGHATACRYSGAKPGVMGVGIYVVWPAFYTDVTDAYRLGRSGRLRTDLGGIYFNSIFALAMGGLFFLTGFEPLLLLVLIQNFAMVQQLLPFLRLDGYYIISDLTGVPDMFSRIKPVFRSLRPGVDEPRVDELKPWVRLVVTSYVLTVVPLLLFALLMALLHAPRMFATAYDSLGVQWDNLSTAIEGGAPVSIAAGGLQVLALSLPLAGMCLTFGRVGSRAGKGAWTWSDGRPERRAGVVAVAGAGLALMAFTWWPNGEYRPIQPGERGTVQGGLRSVAEIPSGRPSLTPERAQELGGAPTARELHGDQRLDETPADAERMRGERAPSRRDGSDGTTFGPGPDQPDSPGTQPTESPQGGSAPSSSGTGSTPSATSTPAPGATATPSPAASATPTPTPTATPTATVTPASTATPTPTP